MKLCVVAKMLPKPWAGRRYSPAEMSQVRFHLWFHVAFGGREEWSELALPAKEGQWHCRTAPGPAASEQLQGLRVLLAQRLSAPDPHVRPKAPTTGVACQHGDMCEKQWECLHV